MMGSSVLCESLLCDRVKKEYKEMTEIHSGSLDSPTVPEITPRCLSDPFMNALVNPNCMWLQGWTFLSKSGEQGLVWVYCSVWMKTCCSLERYVVWESPVLWKHTAQVSRVSELGLMRWPDVSAPAGVVPKMVLISYC